MNFSVLKTLKFISNSSIVKKLNFCKRYFNSVLNIITKNNSKFRKIHLEDQNLLNFFREIKSKI